MLSGFNFYNMEEKTAEETQQKSNETISKVADALTTKLVKLTVPVQKRNWFHGLLQKWKLKERERSFYAGYLTPGNVVRISKLVNAMDMSFKDLLNKETELHKFMGTHGRHLAEIAAICLHNKKTEPPNELIDFIMYNFTANEMFAVLTLMNNRINVDGFIISIVSMSGANVLKETAKKLKEASHEIQKS